jgi:hypothetical protein
MHRIDAKSSPVSLALRHGKKQEQNGVEAGTYTTSTFDGSRDIGRRGWKKDKICSTPGQPW